MIIKHQYIKKLLLRLGGSLGVQGLFYRFRPRDIVLIYHSIESSFSGYEYAVAADVFKEQIKIVKKRFKVVSLREMLKSDNTAPRRAALTFDDAFEDFFEVAFPVLEKNEIPSTIFVPTAFIETGLNMIESKPHCSWQQMRQMRDSGLMEFQSHGHSHKHIKQMGLETLKNDLITSKKIIESNLNTIVDMFAYPGGKFQNWQHEAIFDLGFQAVFTSISKTIDTNRKVFPRIAITNNCDEKSLEMLISGMGEI